MSKASRGLVVSADNGKVGPDYFGYYTHEIVELLSQDEDFFPFTSETPERICNGAGSFFNNGLGAGLGLSDFKKERLKVILRQAVIALTPEVDEMLDPVVNMLQLQSQLRSKGAGSSGDAGQVPQKKFKMSSSSSSTSIPSNASPVNCKSSREGSESTTHIDSKFSDVALSGKGISNVIQKKCVHCHTTKTPQWRNGPEGKKSLCNACGINYTKRRKVQSGSNIRADNENEEVDDLQFLLNNDSLQVEEMMKKYSDQLSGTLGHMEEQLEELLDAVVSKWRPMTTTEKQQLRKLIQNLPPKNLDRVVQIVRRSKPAAETQSWGEIFVDLEKEDNVTLWRLYYYVQAVEKARNLSL